VVDYVVIHELVHLKVKNHSKTFWDSVAALIPDYKHRMAWLKANRHLMTPFDPHPASPEEHGGEIAPNPTDKRHGH